MWLDTLKRWGKGSMSHNQSYTHVFHEHWIWPWQIFQLEAPHMVLPKKPTTTTALLVSSSAYSILTWAGCQIRNLITRAGSSEIWLKRKGTTARNGKTCQNFSNLTRPEKYFIRAWFYNLKQKRVDSWPDPFFCGSTRPNLWPDLNSNHFLKLFFFGKKKKI